MDIARRAQAILLTPRKEWAAIKSEPPAAVGPLAAYALVLAAVPPVFQFLHRVLVERLPVIGHWPVGRALASAAVAYVLGLATVVLFALLVNELAPGFGSAKSLTSALKLAVYAMTPGWVVGVFNIFTGLWALGILASLYGVYILYLGLEAPMMGTPREKVPGYLGVGVLVAAALYIVVNWFLKVIFAVRYGRL